jgi:hypothetical protein
LTWLNLKLWLELNVNGSYHDLTTINQLPAVSWYTMNCRILIDRNGKCVRYKHLHLAFGTKADKALLPPFKKLAYYSGQAKVPTTSSLLYYI